MSIYKIARCPACRYNRAMPRPAKTAPDCTRCGTPMSLSKNWYVRAAGLPARAISHRLADAEAEERKLLTNRAEGRSHLNIAPSTPWATAREKFLEWAEVNVRPKSLAMFQTCLRRLDQNFSRRTLDKITANHLEAYKRERLADGVKPGTVNRELTTIKRMVVLCQQWGLVEVDRLRQVKKLPEPEPRERYLTPKQIDRLLVECEAWGRGATNEQRRNRAKNPHLRLIVLTALHTGLRLGDILTLRRQEIDLREGHLRREIQKKTSRRTLTIPLTTELREALREHMRSGVVSIEGWLFPSPYQTPGEPQRPMRADANFGFQDAAKRAGLKDFHFHDLRHSFATLFLRHVGVQLGRDTALRVLQEILGHTDPRTTQRYAHVLDEYLRNAMADFGSAVARGGARKTAGKK